MLDRSHDTLFFKPGTQWKYSNTGYAVLAAIIEKVSRKTYNDFLKENIFKPLGMERTFVYNSRRATNKIPDNYALGFVYSDSLHHYILPDSLKKFDYVYYLDGIVGDGTVNSTTGDLYKWDRALYGNKLVSKQSLDEMLSPLVLMSARDSSNYYGFGVMVQPKTDRGKMITHSGGWPGYITYLSRAVDSNQAVIILSNNESSAPNINAAINTILANEPLLMPYEHKRINMDTSLISRYEGKYSAFLTLTLVKKNGKLYRQRQGTPGIELIPESETKFYYGDGSDRQIEFELGPDGKVTKAWFINTGLKGEFKKTL
jgi:CubicO group peptidase (beta-lactamase class C family)